MRASGTEWDTERKRGYNGREREKQREREKHIHEYTTRVPTREEDECVGTLEEGYSLDVIVDDDSEHECEGDGGRGRRERRNDLACGHIGRRLML
jgi:hypothetical protein